MGLLTFSQALAQLKAGDKVAREGWNGKGMWLALVLSPQVVGTKPPHDPPEPPMAFESLSFIAMKTADDKFVPWIASQTDLLAEDWATVA